MLCGGIRFKHSKMWVVLDTWWGNRLVPPRRTPDAWRITVWYASPETNSTTIANNTCARIDRRITDPERPICTLSKLRHYWVNIDYKIFSANKEGLAYHIESHQATNEGGGPRWFLLDLRQSKLRFNTRKKKCCEFWLDQFQSEFRYGSCLFVWYTFLNILILLIVSDKWRISNFGIQIWGVIFVPSKKKSLLFFL